MSYVENILAVYAQATPEEIEHGMRWYALAQEASQAIADKADIPLRVAVGVVAALSPTNKWERNLIDADALCEAFVSGGYAEDVACCTYNSNKAKAWRVLEEVPADNVTVAYILNGPKITDFFWCIMGFDTCVIDGHAWCIAHNDRRAMQDVPSIGKRKRRELQDAYTVAAHKHGITAYQMQAITWVAWRRIHGIA